MSAFWNYFANTLRWPQMHAPGALQALTRGLGEHMDATRDDVLYLRDQFFPAKAEKAILPAHGDSRGITRHPAESDAQFRARVVHAWRWHNLGGKTLGLPEILDFYGYPTITIENMRDCNPSRWAEFQIGFKTPVTQAEQQAMLDSLASLLWLVNEYKPARSFFFRMYTDANDWRPVIWSGGTRHDRWSGGWWTYYSGVPIEDAGNQDKDTIVALGMRYSGQANPYALGNICGSFGATTHYGFLAPYIDRPIWSRSAWSDVYPRNHGFAMGSLFSILWADRATAGRCWRGTWDARSWRDYTGFDRKLPHWRMGGRSWSRSQAVFSEGHIFSENNACYSRPTAVILDAPPIWGASRWSAEGRKVHLLGIDERCHDGFGMSPKPVTPGVPHVAGTFLFASTAPVSNPHRVQHARHDAFAASMQQREAVPPPTAARLTLVAQSLPVAPAAALPTVITHYRAPQWLGTWNEPGRTWRTSLELSAQ